MMIVGIMFTEPAGQQVICFSKETVNFKVDPLSTTWYSWSGELLLSMTACLHQIQDLNLIGVDVIMERIKAQGLQNTDSEENDIKGMSVYVAVTFS